MIEQERQQRVTERDQPDEAGGARVGMETVSGSEAGGQAAEEHGHGEDREPLFDDEDAGRFRRRWEDLQAGFVDEPRQMVEQADGLVVELMQQLTTGFDNERASLEAQWEKGDDVSTEELRVALTRYRSFFNRLLSA